MHRLQRIHEFWSWLPAFRAVAETEHLPTAAEMLQVGPSALSRSVRLLEGQLGVALFERSGRSMKLTADGEEMLRAVRDAMRRVDDGVETVQSPSLRGELKIASVGTLAAVVLIPALDRLRREHPELRPCVEVGAPDSPEEELMRGRLDVVLQAGAIAHPEVHCERLLEVELAVFCGPGHPLYEPGVAVDPASLGEHEFVVPPGSERGGRAVDGWPVDRPRRVGLVVDQVRSGCDACASGGYLAVLPVLLAEACAPELRRLPMDTLPGVTAFALRRTAQGVARRVDTLFVEALAETVASHLGA